MSTTSGFSDVVASGRSAELLDYLTFLAVRMAAEVAPRYSNPLSFPTSLVAVCSHCATWRGSAPARPRLRQLVVSYRQSLSPSIGQTRSHSRDEAGAGRVIERQLDPTDPQRQAASAKAGLTLGAMGTEARK